MYTPRLRKKGSGVPILSKHDIDIIGEQLIADFCPDALKTPMAIDIDGFVQNYLGLTQDFQYLSHSGVYLGMMVFNDTNKVPVYDPVMKRAEYISAKARTIIIDNWLLDDTQVHRYRFTMGHEAAHDIFHSGHYKYDPNQTAIFGVESSPMVQCRVDHSKISSKRKTLWTDNDWMEWQANRLSSALLMPASMVKQRITEHLDEPSALQAARCVMDIFHTFNVSIQAAEIRLRGLGILDGISKADIERELTFFAR